MFNILEILDVLIDVPTAEQTDAGSPLNELLHTGIRTNLGNLPIGTVITRHDFNGLLAAPAFYMKCDGSIINEANYNAGHTTTWANDIGTTALDGLYLPEGNDKFIKGVTNTTQDGTGAITFSGNANHISDIDHSHTHSHTVNSHRHRWILYEENYSGGNDKHTSYNSSGTNVEMPVETPNAISPGVLATMVTAGGTTTIGTSYTNNDSPGTDNDATTMDDATQDVEPWGLELEMWMKIV